MLNERIDDKIPRNSAGAYAGNPAISGYLQIHRPEALRPHLAMGMPLNDACSRREVLQMGNL